MRKMHSEREKNFLNPTDINATLDLTPSAVNFS